MTEPEDALPAESRPAESDAAESGLPALDFVTPMPGFPDHRRFVLVRLDESDLLYSLQSLDEPGLRFLVVAPQPFFPDYRVDLTSVEPGQRELLGVEDPDDALVLLVVTPGARPADATANLLAPVLVDSATRRAAQVVLNGTGLPVRAPLAAA